MVNLHATRPETAQNDVRPLLVASLIVRDEEEMLSGCLQALIPLVDRVEICDTGSTDRTVEIAEAAGCHVIHRRWRNDFAWARNEALSQCGEARWVLCLDADELIQCPNPGAVRADLDAAAEAVVAFDMLVSSPRPGGPTSLHRSVRIFRTGTFRFEGSLHEVPITADEGIPVRSFPIPSVSILHLGYNSSVIDAKAKPARNLRIARRSYAVDPSPKTALDLARSISYTDGDLREALLLTEEALSGRSDGPNRAHLLGVRAHLALQLGDPITAFAAAEEALTFTFDDLAASVLARAATLLGHNRQLVGWADRVDQMADDSVFVIRSNRNIFRSAVAAARAQLGDVERAAEEAHNILADDPTEFDGWEGLVKGLAAQAVETAVESLSALTVLDTEGRWLEAVRTTLPPAATAEVCARFFEDGGSASEPVTTGLMAAMLAERWDIVDRLRGGFSTLPADTQKRIVDRFAARGQHDKAAELLCRAIPALACERTL